MSDGITRSGDIAKPIPPYRQQYDASISGIPESIDPELQARATKRFEELRASGESIQDRLWEIARDLGVPQGTAQTCYVRWCRSLEA